MTRNKDLKRAVRERMAKTGERYSTARAHLLGARPEAAIDLGGEHAETAALRGLLWHAGVLDPVGDEPLSEALLLGIGGGLGAAYFVFEYAGHAPTLYVGTRVGHQYPYTAEFTVGVLERLGVAHRVLETGGAKTARAQLDETLAKGAAIAWVDMSSLPYRRMPTEYQGALPHVVLVEEVRDGAARIVDGGTARYAISREALDGARGRYRKAKHRLVAIDHGAQLGDLSGAIEAGLALCVRSMRDGALVPSAAGNFGLSALSKWADLAAASGAKSWQRVFGRGRALFAGLRHGYAWIETQGTGGGGFRPMYAAFLRDAARRLDRPALDDVAARYDALGAQWTDLARAMLPEDSPALAEARTLLEGQGIAARAGGSRAAADFTDASARLEELGASMDAAFPWDEARCAAFYAELAGRVHALYSGERAAIDALAGAM